MPSPTARTLTALRQAGYVAGVVERFIAPIRRRRDLFGCIDIIAVHPSEAGVIGIQATTRGHVRDRLRKAIGRPELRTWLTAGGQFQVWGWHVRDGRWRAERVIVGHEQLAGILVDWPVRRRKRPDGQRQLFRAG